MPVPTEFEIHTKNNMQDIKKRILIIEDELHIAEGLKLNLSLQGYEVVITQDGFAGLQKWKEFKPDLIVLDIMLPGIDGISILQTIRLENEHIPILILSAKGELDDRIKGLTYGVDDYMSKPFNLQEFLLRVERIIKRTTWNQGSITGLPTIQTYKFGNNSIDFLTKRAECQAGTIELTEQEIKLLKLFIQNKGKPLSRESLLAIGWGYSPDSCSRTIDSFMVRFRKYFEENPKRPKFFKSKRSIGYVFEHAAI